MFAFNRGTGLVGDAHLPRCANLRPVFRKNSRAVSSCIRVLDNGNCAVSRADMPANKSGANRS